MDELPEQRDLAGVDEVAVANRSLQARPRGDVSSDEQARQVQSQRLDPETLEPLAGS